MACRCGDIPNAEHDREVLLDMLDRICDTENREYCYYARG